MGPISTWADTLLGGGPAGGRIEIDAAELRLRRADVKHDVPRASVRRAARSALQTKGTIGVHAKGGRWLANGSGGGLVAIEINPPCHTERSLSTLFRRMKVTELIVSLVDPDGFIATAQRDGVHRRTDFSSHSDADHQHRRHGHGHTQPERFCGQPGADHRLRR